ncbi:MAG TPA: DUF3817 domain-containing protein [Cyclobacteriaceae bacterium]|nr:DUF3817 domain-containing protein [Cyclobacteriaceae bacterium]
MKKFIIDPIGRLRLLGFLEGTSFIVLMLIAVPLKHAIGNPALVKMLGPIHGALFLLFVFQTITIALEQGWSFQTRTWKVLAASLIPFGTFYIDRTVLKGLHSEG